MMSEAEVRALQEEWEQAVEYLKRVVGGSNHSVAFADGVLHGLQYVLGMRNMDKIGAREEDEFNI